MEIHRELGKKNFIFASTGGAIVGDGALPIKEDIVANPLSPYGASKLVGEGYLSAYSASYGMNAIALRFANVYGPKSFHKGSVVAEYYRRIMNDEEIIVYGDGNQTRDFIYVGDICGAIESCLSQNVSGTYQLGSGKETSIIELIRTMETVTGKSIEKNIVFKPARNGEVIRSYCDITKAKNCIGYNPKVDLVDGLDNTWNWFQIKNGSLNKEKAA